MPDAARTIPLPPRGFRGLEALIGLGEDGVAKLAEKQVAAPLDLSFSELIDGLADQIGSDSTTLQRAFMDALIPLNGIRRSLEVPPDEFFDALLHTVANRATDEWKAQYFDAWQKIAPLLPPFLQPDNFFSQASKAFELLSQRPAVFQHARILNELRPIYNEDTTATLAMIQTNTLVLRFWDGENERVLHITLDGSDLDDLAEELQRAKQKIRVSRSEAANAGLLLLTYGSFQD